MKRWLSVILMMGFILALNPLGAEARRSSHWKHHPKYHRHYQNHHHCKDYGWDGHRHHDYGRHHKYYRSSWRGPHRYRHYVRHAGPPSAVYVTPVAPVVEIPYSQPQPFYNQPATPDLFGEYYWNY